MSSVTSSVRGLYRCRRIQDCLSRSAASLKHDQFRMILPVVLDVVNVCMLIKTNRGELSSQKTSGVLRDNRWNVICYKYITLVKYVQLFRAFTVNILLLLLLTYDILKYVICYITK